MFPADASDLTRQFVPDGSTVPLDLGRLRALPASDRLDQLRADQSRRWRNGERLPAERYFELFPSIIETPADALVLICGEILLRKECRDLPNLTEYQQRFPDLADDLALQFDLLDAWPEDATQVSEVSPATHPLAPRNPDADWQPTIPGYSLLRQLGEGGMGRVYHARHETTGREVALKVIRRSRQEQPEVVRRFLREMRALSHLDHPNLAKAFDAGEAEGAYYFTMQYSDGSDLGHTVRDSGPLSIADACACALQTARALAYIHEQGIVHRDLKPSNLVRSIAGRVLLVDLGLASLRGSPGLHRSSTITGPGQLLGTIDFIAPEQIASAHHADGRADLYALGGTLHFLLTGQPPFPGGEFLAKLKRHRIEIPVPVPTLRREVPAALGAVVQRLLAKKPEERFQTAGELADTLTQLDLITTSQPETTPWWHFWKRG